MQVYEISRKALKELEPRILGGRSHADEWDTARFVVVRGEYATRRRSVMHRDSLYISVCSHFDSFDDAVCEFEEKIDHDYCMGYRLNVYEIWRVVDDEDQQPKHDTEHVNECGKKPFRHVSVKFDEKESEAVTPPTITDEDWKELDRIFPPMYKVKRLCVLSVGFVSTPESWETHIEHCYSFVADGIRFLYSKISHPLNRDHAFYEFAWTVADDADFTALAGFMSKMASLGCIIEFGWRNVEVAR